MISSLPFSHQKLIADEILVELWKNAVFDEQSYLLVKNLVTTSIQLPKRKFVEKVLSDAFFSELATIRNRHLITSKGQKKLRESVVAIFGLSVGSHVAATWVMQSRPNHVKIADHDTVSPSNLNRLRTGWFSVGMKKTQVVEDELHSLHPSVHVHTLTDTTVAASQKLLNASPKTDLIVDAIDSFAGKVMLREYARKHRIPLLSAADVGDMVVLDIERYDLSPQPQPFLGRISSYQIAQFKGLSEKDRRKLIISLVGLEKNNSALLTSLSEIGKSLSTWPQLGATAVMAGGIMALTMKKILLGERVKSGRYYFSLDEVLLQHFSEEIQQKEYQTLKQKVIQKFQLDEDI